MYNLFMKRNISEKVINRLTLYHYILQDFAEKNIEYISSKQIATLLKIDDSQVRKDLNLLNNSGKSRVGYIVDELKQSIENTLGFEKRKKAIIVGAGNLGMALAKYDNFTNYGLNIIGLFDNNPNKTGKVINNKQVLNIKKLKEFMQKNPVEIAILTVPAQNAQETAQYLASLNIKYIWNFTPKILDLDENVQVWNENLMGNFLQFTYEM